MEGPIVTVIGGPGDGLVAWPVTGLFGPTRGLVWVRRWYDVTVVVGPTAAVHSGAPNGAAAVDPISRQCPQDVIEAGYRYAVWSGFAGDSRALIAEADI